MCFPKESFDKFSGQKKWDQHHRTHPQTQMFSTKVYLLALVEQQQLDDFLDGETSKADTYTHPSHQWHPLSS